MQDETQNPMKPEDENLPQDADENTSPQEPMPEAEPMTSAEDTAENEVVEPTSEEIADTSVASAETGEEASLTEANEGELTEEAPAEVPAEPELPARQKRVRANPDVKKAREQFDEMVDESEDFFDKASRISEGISAEAEVKDKVFERKNIAYEIEAATEEEAPTETTSAEESAELVDEDKPEWKQNAEKIYEKRSSRKQRMIEERRKMDEIVREKQRKREEALRTGEQETRERILEDARKRREEKEQAFQEMMQRAREEKERKRRAALGLAPAEDPATSNSPAKSSNLDERTSRLAKDDDEDEG